MVLGAIVGLIWMIWDIMYWGKYLMCTIALRIKKLTKRRRFDLYDFEVEDDPEKLALIAPKEEVILESPQAEENLQNSADEIFIYGVSAKSEALVVRISRYCNDESEALIHLKLKDGRTYNLNKTKGYQCITDGKNKAFSCDGLKIYTLCAMRRWRIIYRGMLRERTDDDKKPPVFVKFSFIWSASSEVYDTTSDLDIKGTARAMAEEKWTSLNPPLKKLDLTLNSYCQSGVMNGIVTIEDEPEKEIYLFGERIRHLGETSNLEGSKFKRILGVIPKSGMFIHLDKMSIPNVIQNLYSGFIVNPSSKIDVIEDGLIISKMSQFKTNLNISAIFKAGNQYELHGNGIGKCIPLSNDETNGENTEMTEINFKIGNYNGYGFIFSGEIFKRPRRSSIKKPVFPSSENRPLTVYFTEEVSHLVKLAGGKGSSLGKLTNLSSKMKSEFVVPKGIVVTTEAYDKFLTGEITEKINKMKNVIYGITEGNVHEACKAVQTAVENASLPKQLTIEIESKLKTLFHNNTSNTRFAVRSSATEEDTDQMSAAGQMDTFLGVQGLEEIFNALKKCWASQFGYIAVEYKRQNGQLLNSSMAVVIQEMVECESSGVLFTCDPVNNNPSVIVITCNYGLGETVVSGSEEPDTIILQRISSETVEIQKTIIGLKKRKVILADSNLSDQKGTVLQEVTEDKQNECCISEEIAINLGNLSLKIENYFKSPRDIEWGIKNNKIFILQSRPITTGESMSDFEIMHEFDGTMRSEDDFITTCNVGEVMPNAISPLGFEILNKGFTIPFKTKHRLEMARNYYGQTIYFPTGLILFYNRVFLSAIEVLTLASNDMDSNDVKGLMISVFGRVLDDPELRTKVQEMNYPQPKFKLKDFYHTVRVLFFSRIGLNNYRKKIFNYPIQAINAKTSKEIFSLLLKFCSHVSKPFDRHMDCSMASSAWNMNLFSVLSNAKGVIDNDVYSDFATLLASSSNVESADVPAAMQILAQLIAKDIDTELFKKMSVEDAQQWLETSPTKAGIKYRQFIERHGHRCVNETDVYSIPWNMDPKPLVKLLQNMTGVGEAPKAKEEANFSNILPHLKIPLNFKSKLLVRFILANCRNGIRGREMCKSITIKSVDNIRKCFRHLSRVMVAEGYIPDAELVFFLTLDEIKDLLDTRNPSIIARAKHRRKLFPLLNSFSFPEMSKGLPIPENSQQDTEAKYEANFSMKGIPVSQGLVKGYARVAVSLNEAANLKPGEILIAHSTDVAWSPYFAFLGGVVTELGGLISHGAVVSREYGLPCVVGLHGATKHFVTGDYVLLDGNKGILQRLSQEEHKKKPVAD